MKTTDRTLSQVMSELSEEGYKEQFVAEEKYIKALNEKRNYDPEELKVINTYLFDGMTNPSDEEEILAIETKDGLRGTLVMAGGAEQSQNVELIKRIPLQED